MRTKGPSLFGDDTSEPEIQPQASPPHSPSYVSSVWSFTGSGRGSSSYRWYGTLPAPLVERLFSLYAPVGRERVLDGFLGSGTSLEVAARLGHELVGVDCNPLACLIAEGRLHGPHPISSVLDAAARVVSQFADREEPRRIQAFADALQGEAYDYTRKWFREDSLLAALRLLALISQVRDPDSQRLLFVAAAQSVRELANVDARCTHHLVTKKKPYKSPLPTWHGLVTALVESHLGHRSHRCRVVQGSVLADSVSGPFDFGILHPPYLGVIHYHLIHRLATDLLRIAAEVGSAQSLARFAWAYDAVRDADFSTDNEGRYLSAVRKLAFRARTLFRDGARCVVIMGDQRHKGLLRHPFTEVIANFKEHGFALEENFIWLLQNNGGMHVLRRGHFIDHNYILVFRRMPDK